MGEICSAGPMAACMAANSGGAQGQKGRDTKLEIRANIGFSGRSNCGVEDKADEGDLFGAVGEGCEWRTLRDDQNFEQRSSTWSRTSRRSTRLEKEPGSGRLALKQHCASGKLRPQAVNVGPLQGRIVLVLLHRIFGPGPPLPSSLSPYEHWLSACCSGYTTTTAAATHHRAHTLSRAFYLLLSPPSHFSSPTRISHRPHTHHRLFTTTTRETHYARPPVTPRLLAVCSHTHTLSLSLNYPTTHTTYLDRDHLCYTAERRCIYLSWTLTTPKL
ncbi:hypothetical protein Q7P37_004068 [Cladosporium fusiforme]